MYWQIHVFANTFFYSVDCLFISFSNVFARADVFNFIENLISLPVDEVLSIYPFFSFINSGLYLSSQLTHSWMLHFLVSTPHLSWQWPLLSFCTAFSNHLWHLIAALVLTLAKDGQRAFRCAHCSDIPNDWASATQYTWMTELPCLESKSDLLLLFLVHTHGLPLPHCTHIFPLSPTHIPASLLLVWVILFHASSSHSAVSHKRFCGSLGCKQDSVFLRNGLPLPSPVPGVPQLSSGTRLLPDLTTPWRRTHLFPLVWGVHLQTYG